MEYLVHSPMIRQSHFQRVILMSGSMFSTWARMDNPSDTAVKLARELGCSLPADLYTHHSNIIDCLRFVYDHLIIIKLVSPAFLCFSLKSSSTKLKRSTFSDFNQSVGYSSSINSPSLLILLKIFHEKLFQRKTC